jgi:hypothetical protein
VTAVNTTDEWWEIDGTSLNLPGWNITTLGGSRFGVPALRGDDVQYAYVPGEEWRAKEPAARVLTLAMWMLGITPETENYNVDQRRQWNDNWNRLRKLFWQPKRQFVLTRRWLLSDDEGEPYIQTAEALGQYAGGLEPNMTGRTRANFTVDIKLTDPFFYGTEISTPVGRNSTVAITNPGDYVAAHNHVQVELVGPLTAPITLYNLTADPTVYVTFNENIASGASVTLDVGAFTATLDADVVVAPNRIGKVTHSGARRWFGLFDESNYGPNSVRLEAPAGTGHAEVRFRPPYL